MASHPIFEFMAELSDYRPKIWRRFQVSSDFSLARLAYVVMTMFEMQASHLFAVEVFKRKNLTRFLEKDFPESVVSEMLSRHEVEEAVRYEIIGDDYDYPGREPLDPVRVKLKQAIGQVGDELCVDYDFGDGWRVLLTIEDVFEDKDLPGKELPRVLAGEGFGIIEDCGGPGGLKQLARSFSRKKGTEYRENREWLGVDDLDLSTFDLDDMNFRVKKIPRIYADIYERDLPPTKASMDLLLRKYKDKGK